MSGIVVIGAGQAAGQAAASLRQEGYEGEVTLLGDEAQAPYQRPPLSKAYLSGDIGMDRVLVRPENFYPDKNINLKTNTRVASIDRDNKSVTTESGETYEYEKLLIATGSSPRILNIPGSDLEGIHYLRTIDDVDGIRGAFEKAGKICIVGGGYIGLEVAAVAKKAGLDVTVVEAMDRILQRVTTPEMSDFYHNLHTGRGVNIMVNTGVDGFEGDGEVSAVLCGDTKIEADLVIVGIGIIPNVALAEAAGLECDNGIVVNDHCQTSDPDIYAAGDCTNHPNPIMDRRLRLESVPNAMGQARTACSNMLGGDKVYAEVPWFWSDQYELKLQMVGFSADGDSSVVRGDKDANQFAVFYLKEGKVVAVDAVNSPKEFMVCKQLYGKPADAAALADPETELKSLLG
ncbi:MAG: FAD-dependent oxidoreductase [Pseudomonadales bacterium]|nr:FAD-dependent oxidoreductase [Pseudomonadales bacterium]MBO6564827.1 FAD-dependent oxidoreductase [Pseudomonadales bacterium]MBO6595526.1 FAD-dependent oxidoreductase [Pseudomonadales bacterium]MBO6820915.1 FAD-dependent oxidoreductase [Pseudomonadales bacterium]